MQAPSIFNDVIGPVMRGPSSSHCAAALRIGRLARDLMDGRIDEVTIEYDPRGSLATTHDSQGSDMGLLGGLLGWEATDERLLDSARAIRQAGIEVHICAVQDGRRQASQHLSPDAPERGGTAPNDGHLDGRRHDRGHRDRRRAGLYARRLFRDPRLPRSGRRTDRPNLERADRRRHPSRPSRPRRAVCRGQGAALSGARRPPPS